MIISLTLQFKIVIFSILAGILTGFLFDFYRTFRGFEKVYKIFIIIEDILFWILASIVVFVFLLYTNYAFMSIYVYIYIAFGIYIYMRLISKIFTSLQLKLINISTKLLRVSVNFILYPIKLLGYNIGSKNKRKNKRNDLNNT
jgi:spore cortex biosynthesis protein YabQ